VDLVDLAALEVLADYVDLAALEVLEVLAD
jgi:hypothetical protein